MVKTIAILFMVMSLASCAMHTVTMVHVWVVDSNSTTVMVTTDKPGATVEASLVRSIPLSVFGAP